MALDLVQQEIDFYVARHCHSEQNADGKQRGIHAKLTEQGHQEKLALAIAIAELKVQALFTSTAIRSLETSQAISFATGLRLQETHLLLEARGPSLALGKHANDPVVVRPKEYVDKVLPIIGGRLSDEQTFPERQKQVRDMFDLVLQYVRTHQITCVVGVSHFKTMLMMLCQVETLNMHSHHDFADREKTIRLANAGICHFKYELAHPEAGEEPAYRWQLRGWNETAHLRSMKK